jgi:hypothetical protein
MLVAVGALFAEGAAGLAHLRDAPFSRLRKGLLDRLTPCFVDAALAVCAALAIGEGWLRSLFPPLALVGALHAARAGRWPGPAALLGDRALLALVFAVASALDLAEPAVMLAALAVIALDAAVFRGKSRITPG